MQRWGKRKLDRGEPSRGMTAERATKLEALGFVWERGHVTAPTAPEVAEGEEGEEEVEVQVEEDDDGYAEVLQWQPRVSARVRTKPARPGMVDPTQPGASSVEWRCRPCTRPRRLIAVRALCSQASALRSRRAGSEAPASSKGRRRCWAIRPHALRC